MDVEPNLFFGQLETKWFWNNKRCGNIWKCICDCGGYCYVKEKALILGIVKNCGAECHLNAHWDLHNLIGCIGYAFNLCHLQICSSRLIIYIMYILEYHIRQLQP